MFDFLKITNDYDAKKKRYVYKPSFIIKSNIRDLMTRARDFYAIFDENTNLWVTDEDIAIEMIDKQTIAAAQKDYTPELFTDPERGPIVQLISNTDNKLIDKWHKFVQRDLRDHYIPLNQVVKFSNSKVTRNDYCTFTLSYPIVEGPTPFYDKLVNTLYLPEEREKFEWAMGCLLAGDQAKIQKMFLFYGTPGSGKSTIVKEVMVNTLLENSVYATDFKAEDLVNGESFATAFLSRDPALCYDVEAGLERIDSSGTLNKLVSHEPIKVNDKFKGTFSIEPKCLVVCCSNDTIQLTPGKGMSRRLVDIRQTGVTLPPEEYDECIQHLQFERSGIAYHCLQVYKKRGKNYYSHYRPEDMMRMTSPFQNFVADNYLILREGCTLFAAYDLYEKYAKESNFKTILTRYRFRDNLRLYYKFYSDGEFKDFKPEMIGLPKEDKPIEEREPIPWLQFNETKSLFDEEFKDLPAQYASEEGTPLFKWDNVTTKLSDIDTTKLHYVLPPDVLICIDLDIKGEDGKKCFDKNFQEALKFPPTYAELSKSGEGIHLYYIYNGGDPSKLSRVYSENVEVKVFTGKSSLRRKLTKCNDLQVATLSSGLPIKEEKPMGTWEGFSDEKKLINTIKKALRKEIPGCEFTKPAVDFIVKLLKEAYASGKTYDVRSLQEAVISFALSSTHNAEYCIDQVTPLHFCSKDVEDRVAAAARDQNRLFAPDAPIIFFDCEVFKNLFVICWKYQGPDKTIVKMVNPKPDDVKRLFHFRMIGFNNRNYDNHILWAAASGYSHMELYNLSQRLIAGDRDAKFGQAYNLSYTDIYDFARNDEKKSLKKFEIQFIKEGKAVAHHENAIPWDQEVPENRFDEIADYCADDVRATEATFNEISGSWTAREMLSELANDLNVGTGITASVNDTTNQLTTKGIFGKDKNPGLIYTDLSTGKQYGPGEDFKVPVMNWDDYWNSDLPNQRIEPTWNCFPEYRYVKEVKTNKKGITTTVYHNMYRGVDLSFGGHVYANPGMYGRAKTFDVRSMHPNSVIDLNLFGDVYTAKFEDLVNLRAFIKHKKYDEAAKMFNGVLAKYLQDESSAKALSSALKTAINSVYGLTSAGFPNAFKDERNVNNIVALRGALFMESLRDEVESRGFKVIHIKTDSIKISNPTDEITDFCFDYAKKYGYEFEVEHTWKKICLVNNAVFVGLHDDDDPESPGEWETTGTQFQVPYVKKTLFTHEPIDFYDMTETKSVQNAMYLGDQFIGKVGLFCPMTEGGKELLSLNNAGKLVSVSGAKDYKWMEASDVKNLHMEDKIDISYYRRLVDDAIETISQYGDFNTFATK